MAEDTDQGAIDTFRDKEEPRSSQLVWDAICEAKAEFDPYYEFCNRIDRIVSAAGDLSLGRGYYYTDQEFDLFWASLEILKPAVYCKPPQAVVAPRFADRNKVASVASELLERCLNSVFERDDFDQTMLEVRDDLILAARGVIRVTYEADSKGKRICSDHVDRTDYLQEPARKYKEVGWQAFAAYLDEKAYKKRFPGKDLGQFNVRRDRTDNTLIETTKKCKVWEVWHRADNRVYWVTEGVNVFLDEQKPFLDLDGFFPAPRPAYGTLRRRSLIPVPDYARYERHLDQINILTARIYNLLEWIKVKGLIPAGGDAATAVATAMANSEDDVLLIPVPGAALMSNGSGTAGFVQFLPIQEFAATVTNLLEARRELINNFYELSGISDIMRGATEAEETLGAQQLKSQYGSVRVREKIDELQRIARDTARIAGEILAEKFDPETLIEMAQMEIPTKAELEKQVKTLKDAAEKEMDALEKQAQQMVEQAQASGQQVDPQQAEQQFNQAQQQIIAKYQPQLDAIGKTVPREDVMNFLRDQKTRAFAIDIETDSTVMVDEMAEKQARGEFLAAFANASATIMPLMAAGEEGAKLGGSLLKFSLAPFRAGRELDGLIDDFVEKAPAALAQQQSGGGEGEAALAEANMQLAQAELQKAQAQTEKVQADAALKGQELQLKAAEAQEKAKADQQKFALELESTKGTIAETSARIEKIYAEIQLAEQKLGLEAHREQREDVKTVADIQSRQVDQQMNAQNQQRQAIESERSAQMGERQQSFNEQQGTRQQDFTERQADRQQTLAERQAQREGVE